MAKNAFTNGMTVTEITRDNYNQLFAFWQLIFHREGHNIGNEKKEKDKTFWARILNPYKATSIDQFICDLMNSDYVEKAGFHHKGGSYGYDRKNPGFKEQISDYLKNGDRPIRKNVADVTLKVSEFEKGLSYLHFTDAKGVIVCRDISLNSRHLNNLGVKTPHNDFVYLNGLWVPDEYDPSKDYVGELRSILGQNGNRKTVANQNTSDRYQRLPLDDRITRLRRHFSPSTKW